MTTKPSDAMVKYGESLSRTKVLSPISGLLEDAGAIAGTELTRLKTRALSGTLTNEDVNRLAKVVASLKVLKETERMIREDENVGGLTTEELENELLGKGGDK